MATDLLILSIFSLLLLLIFVSIKKPSKNFTSYRWLCALLSGGATISNLLLLKYALVDKISISAAYKTDILPFDFGIYLGPSNIIFIFLAIIALYVFLFTSEYLIFIKNIHVIISSTIFIIISQIFPDILISFYFFCISIIIINFVRIFNNNELSHDFMSQITTNIIILISLITNYYFLIFVAILFRLISLRPNKAENKNDFSQTYYHGFVALATLIFFNKAHDLIFSNLNFILLYKITAIILVFSGFIYVIFNRKNINISSQVFLASSMLLLLYCFSNSEYYYLLNMILIYMPYMKFPNKFSSENTYQETRAHRTMLFLSRGISDFFNLFYANFLLLFLPKIIILIIQIPLRFFYNGSIHRSIIFIILILTCYYAFWGGI